MVPPPPEPQLNTTFWRYRLGLGLGHLTAIRTAHDGALVWRERYSQKSSSISPSMASTAPPSGDPGPCFEVCACCNKGSEETVKALGLSRKRYVSGTALLRCAGCRSAYFCGTQCQKAVWKTHKLACLKWKEGLVACVELADWPAGRSPKMQQVFHPVAYLQQLQASFPSPIMALVGIPLMVSPLERGTNNQWCTYMMAEPSSGFAPMQFQDLGKSILWRRDLMPITEENICVLGDFFRSHGPLRRRRRPRGGSRLRHQAALCRLCPQ